MKPAAALAIAALAIGGARAARTFAAAERGKDVVEEPYAPSPGAAPFISLGYRELAADLMFVRLRGYFGGGDTTARGLASLVEATVAVDPGFHRIYSYGAGAMTLAKTGVDQSIFLRAIAVLDRGARLFPHDWRLPFAEGQSYMLDLKTTDPAQRRAWDQKAALLIESATRMPGAPATAAEWAAIMQTKLGEHERAVENLREMLLITDDAAARKALIARLAKLQHQDADELAGELYEARLRFVKAWQRDRPTIPSTMYVLLGPRLGPAFDLTDLATGGRDLVGSKPIEKLEPLY